MNSKEEKFFKIAKWFHGTTLHDWKNMCNTLVNVKYNIGTSLDFGNGFYLSPNEKNTQLYAINTVKYNNIFEDDYKTPVVIEFEYVPYQDIMQGANYKYFAKYDNDFANFVFTCRNNYMYEKTHPYDITGGVMTDAIPTKLMQEFAMGIRSKESVINEFMKSTSKKQLCLHTQELCDKLLLRRAYIVNGEELDINEYKKK